MRNINTLTLPVQTCACTLLEAKEGRVIYCHRPPPWTLTNFAPRRNGAGAPISTPVRSEYLSRFQNLVRDNFGGLSESGIIVPVRILEPASFLTISPRPDSHTGLTALHRLICPDLQGKKIRPRHQKSLKLSGFWICPPPTFPGPAQPRHRSTDLDPGVT